jgi:hypothetical protein
MKKPPIRKIETGLPPRKIGAGRGLPPRNPATINSDLGDMVERTPQRDPPPYQVAPESPKQEHRIE